MADWLLPVHCVRTYAISEEKNYRGKKVACQQGMKERKKSRKTHTGVVPWPAVLAPGDEVAKVIGKPPLILFIIELNVSKGDL